MSDHPTSRKPNPVDQHVGRRLRLARTLTGLSQRDLGAQLGLTFQQVQKYEQGLNRVGAGHLGLFARVLGVPVDFFFDDMPAEVLACPPGAILASSLPGEPIHNPAVDREILEVVRAFQAISSAKLRREVCSLAEGLSANPPRRRRR